LWADIAKETRQIVRFVGCNDGWGVNRKGLGRKRLWLLQSELHRIVMVQNTSGGTHAMMEEERFPKSTDVSRFECEFPLAVIRDAGNGRRWNISEKSCNIADIANEARQIVRFVGCNWLRGEQEGTGKEAFVATAVCASQFGNDIPVVWFHRLNGKNCLS
jgi:hypothetical protein